MSCSSPTTSSSDGSSGPPWTLPSGAGRASTTPTQHSPSSDTHQTAPPPCFSTTAPGTSPTNSDGPGCQPAFASEPTPRTSFGYTGIGKLAYRSAQDRTQRYPLSQSRRTRARTRSRSAVVRPTGEDGLAVVAAQQDIAFGLCSGGPVVPDGRGQGEKTLAGVGENSGRRAAAVLSQAELALEGVDDRFDPLAHAGRPAMPGGRPCGRVTVDRCGTPLAVTLTGGNRHDVTQLLPCWTRYRRFEDYEVARGAGPGGCSPAEARTSTSTAACYGSAASSR